MPFRSTIARVATSDGRNVVLLEPLVYVANSGEVIEIPAGASSDGASTPREIWPLVPPFGPYWLAAILHDYLYRQTSRPREECDALLLEAMESLGVDLMLRETIYEGVRVGGRGAFSEDRRAA